MENCYILSGKILPSKLNFQNGNLEFLNEKLVTIYHGRKTKESYVELQKMGGLHTSCIECKKNTEFIP